MKDDLGDLTNKVVVLNRLYYTGTENERHFLCLSGFGCSPYAIGNAIFGKFVFDGEECRIERYEVEKLAPETHPCD